MNKLWNIVQYGYLIVAAICFIDGISKFNTNRNGAYLYIAFSVFLIFIFLIKRKFRKKIEERNRNKRS